MFSKPRGRPVSGEGVKCPPMRNVLVWQTGSGAYNYSFTGSDDARQDLPDFAALQSALDREGGRDQLTVLLRERNADLEWRLKSAGFDVP